LYFSSSNSNKNNHHHHHKQQATLTASSIECVVNTTQLCATVSNSSEGEKTGRIN
jgi:hypothetical protein